jgi:hypothetical protein
MNENHTPPPPPSQFINAPYELTSAGRLVFDFVDNHQFRIRQPLGLEFLGGWGKKTKNQRTARTLKISDKKERMWLIFRTLVNISELVL